ncbi:MAG: DUF1573 domain-containing protein, partial [Bacteroidales bacterium]|nr:DUF1573 domain-containing protein [Bacteroidales bacterium]
MKNRTMFFVVMMLLFHWSSFAQQKMAEITFKEKVFQIGTVKEESGKINIDFEFTNTGADNLIISEVKTEKGVELLNWPQESIIPGSKGMISAVFYPKGNSGRINKRISVYSNSNSPIHVVTINGHVTPIPNSLADKYRRTLGNTNLRLKTTYLTLGDITNKEDKEGTLDIVNTASTPMKLGLTRVPKHISVEFSKNELQPNEEGTINITYHAALNKNNDGSSKWGAQNDRFYVVIDGDVKGSNRNTISVRASIKEDFSDLTEEELANAPSIEFEKLIYDFGTINQGDVITYDFKYKNVGQNDLEIRH